MNVILVPEEKRPFTQEDFTRVWRKEIGPLPEVKSLFFEYLVGPGGNRSLKIRLSHPNNTILEEAARELKSQMEQIKGIIDVTDGISEGKQQLRFQLSEEAKALGLTENDLGRQLRNAFFGAEALRQLRDVNEIKVMVRLPAEERRSIGDLADFMIRAPGGVEIPLTLAATVDFGRAFTEIRREDGARILRIQGGVDKKAGGSRRRSRKILNTEILPELAAKYPGLKWSTRSGRRGRDDLLGAIVTGVSVMLILIYALMAALFRSYVQGLIVVATVPFSVAAAIVGHVVMGYDLSSVSVYGIIALGGLVVNGALVLTVRYNQLLPTADDIHEAIVGAAVSRFRPIFLTSMTTTVGLLPMLFETSVQALFLVPMAIALSFGVLFSAFVVLLLIPSLHAIHHDIAKTVRSARPVLSSSG